MSLKANRKLYLNTNKDATPRRPSNQDVEVIVFGADRQRQLQKDEITYLVAIAYVETELLISISSAMVDPCDLWKAP